MLPLAVKSSRQLLTWAIVVTLIGGGLHPAAGEPILCAAEPQSVATPRGFMNRVHRRADGTAHPFIVYVPSGDKQPSAEGRPPALLFLHGAGERGANNLDQVIVGLGPAIMRSRAKFPFVAVFPQCPLQKNWTAGTAEADLALAMLAQTEQEFQTDPERVYLTGLSMGGQGTWTIAAQHPTRFAAVLPMCARPDPRTATIFAARKIPVWNFCGDRDAPETVAANRAMAAALHAAGAESKYTEYPQVGHNCWDAAYGSPDWIPWLLTHRRVADALK